MKKLDFSLTIASNALLCPNPEEFYSKVYLSGEDLNFFKILPGVKNSTKVSTTTFPSVLQALDCVFAASASNLSATTVTVCPLKANVSVCKTDLESSFLVNQMRAGETNYDVQSYMNFYWEELRKEIGQELAVIRWQGDTAGTGATFTGNFAFKTLCDGLEKKMLANAAVVDITLTAVTTSNVIALLSAVINAAPAAVKAKEAGAVFYVSSTVATAYRIAAALGNTQAFITGEMPLSFAGYQMVEAPGMTDGNIVFTRPANLVYAFDGSEEGSIEAIDQLKTVGIPNILTVVLLAVGYEILNPSEIVWMHA
jgi:hypothetical protein